MGRIEGDHTDAVAVPASPERVGRRRELVARYVMYRAPAVEFARFEVKPAGHLKALLTDIYDVGTKTLHEVKASARRDDIRMAVGQLLDYRRHIDVPDLRLAILVPDRPSADLIDFAHSVGAGCTWELPTRRSLRAANSGSRTTTRIG